MSESNWLQSSVANAYGGSMKITSNAADFAEPPAASAFEAERAAPEATYFSALADDPGRHATLPRTVPLQRGQRLGDQRRRRSGGLYRHQLPRAAAQRLDAQRPGPGEQIQYAGVVQHLP